MNIKLTVASVVAILTLLFWSFLSFSSVSGKAGSYTHQIQMNADAIKELKVDVQNIISKTDKIGTDIEWIKETLRQKL